MKVTIKGLAGAAGMIAIIGLASYCSELPKYRFEGLASETARALPGFRLIDTGETRDLASPVTLIRPPITRWTYAAPDRIVASRFFLLSMMYGETDAAVYIIDADCENQGGDRRVEWYSVDQAESARPARDLFGDPVKAPNGKTFRLLSTAPPTPDKWMSAFCASDWTAERRAINDQRH